MLWLPAVVVGSVGSAVGGTVRIDGEVAPMLVVIAFESVSGSTCEVAEAVASGLREGPSPPRVECAIASALAGELVVVADLLVVGGHTHYPGFPANEPVPAGRELRRALLTGHLRPCGLDAPGECLDGDADLRAWLRRLPDAVPGRLGAAFDTRLTSRWAGGAADAIARRLRRHGYDLAVPPEGYLVDGLPGPLRAGETDRARLWGAVLRRRLPQ